MYAAAPSWINPNGAAGIAVHYDVGLAAPDPRETRYGAWGGGNTCFSQACATNTAYLGSCAGGPAMTDARKWLFFWGIDWRLAGGTSPVLGSNYFADTLAAHMHELGHAAGLWHEGPVGTAESSLTCTGYNNSWRTGNYRPNFLSRMNYRYTYYAGAGGEDPVAYDTFSFSDGTLLSSLPSGGLSNAAAPEVCPFPGRSQASLAVLQEALPGNADNIWTVPGTAGCADVNWDDDRTGIPAIFPNIEAGNTHVFVNENLHVERRRYLEPFRAPATEGSYAVGPGGALIVNNVLLYAYRACTAAGVCDGRLRGESNMDCLVYPNNPDSPSWIPTEGSYPSCFRPGTTVAAGSSTLDPESLALAAYQNAGGSGAADRAVVVLMRGSGGIDYSLFNPQPSAGAAEFTGAPTTFISTGIVGATGATYGDLSAVRVPGTNDVLVTYHTAAGNLRQFAIDPDAGTVSSSSAATDLSGTALSLSTSSASMAEVDGRLFMVRHVSTSGTGMQLFRLAATGTPVQNRGWELMRTLPAITGRTPSIVRSLEYGTSSSRVYVFGQLTSPGAYWFHRAPVSTTWFSGAATWETTRVFEVNSALAPGTAAGVFDDRPGLPAGTRGLRLVRGREFAGTFGLEHDPFADGADPSVGLDHNEWDGLQWGICRTNQQRDAFSYVAVTTSYVPTPYSDPDRCGDAPNYYVATPTGPLLMVRGNGHRYTTPGLYPGGMTCSSGP